MIKELWKKYKNQDPEYISLDKKLFKAEKKEIRFKDKNYREKFDMIELGKLDYKKGIRGKYKNR